MSQRLCPQINLLACSFSLSCMDLDHCGRQNSASHLPEARSSSAPSLQGQPSHLQVNPSLTKRFVAQIWQFRTRYDEVRFRLELWKNFEAVRTRNHEQSRKRE